MYIATLLNGALVTGEFCAPPPYPDLEANGMRIYTRTISGSKDLVRRLDMTTAIGLKSYPNYEY